VARVAGRDEVALECLVRRHGPGILRLCRRALRHDHDAEDIFQATFFLLARCVLSLLFLVPGWPPTGRRCAWSLMWHGLGRTTWRMSPWSLTALFDSSMEW
jgi:hypothetical protein